MVRGTCMFGPLTLTSPIWSAGHANSSTARSLQLKQLRTQKNEMKLKHTRRDTSSRNDILIKTGHTHAQRQSQSAPFSRAATTIFSVIPTSNVTFDPFGSCSLILVVFPPRGGSSLTRLRRSSRISFRRWTHKTKTKKRCISSIQITSHHIRSRPSMSRQDTTEGSSSRQRQPSTSHKTKNKKDKNKNAGNVDTGFKK